MLKNITKLIILSAFVVVAGVAVSPSAALAAKDKNPPTKNTCEGLDPLLCETTH